MKPEQVKALRLHLGMTQKEFAHSIGNLADQVCRWERGKKKMSKAYETLIQAKYKKELKAIS